MSKSLKKTLLIVGIAAAVCAAVWGGLTLARNAQRGDVKVFDVPSFAMTDYWGDTANTSGTVSTDKLQKIYLSQSQTVSQVYVKEGQNVKKGDKLLAYDTTLSQAEVEGAQIQLERMQLELETAKNNLSLYRKAENREELQKEYDRVAAILEKLRSQQDQLAGRGSPVKQGRLGDSLGQSKDKPLYYQWLEDTRTKEYYLTDEIIRNDILPKSRNSAYVVLVTQSRQREQRRHHLLRHVHRGRGHGDAGEAEGDERPARLSGRLRDPHHRGDQGPRGAAGHH